MEKEVLEYIKYGLWILFGSGLFLEVSPIKWNPLSIALAWLGKKLNRDMKKDILQLQSDVNAVQLDLQDHKISSWRKDILQFAEELMRGEQKSRESFEFIVRTHDFYEAYLRLKNLDNGQVALSYDYIKIKYHEHMENNSFYVGK